MKAVRLIETDRPLELQEIPLPDINGRNLLVRIEAAGICHSDLHYRAGNLPAGPLPVTLGHEIAGTIEEVGDEVTTFTSGDRVCLHYLITCGTCEFCKRGIEQFCTTGQMLGKDRDGGYAEYIRVPERSVFPLPPEIPFDQGAVLMCSSATSLHALGKARFKPGETAAIWGVGGLGMSAIQLARFLGARQVFAVDINPLKLEVAVRFGSVPIDAGRIDPVKEIMRSTEQRGVDVALELIGSQFTIKQALGSLAVGGRVAVAGLSERAFTIDPYRELLGREAEIIGVSDHLSAEIPLLTELVRNGDLVLDEIITKTVPLEAEAINDILDGLERPCDDIRAVILPR